MSLATLTPTLSRPRERGLDSTLDRWVQRVTTATLLALGLGLLALGVALYTPGADAQARFTHSNSEVRP